MGMLCVKLKGATLAKLQAETLEEKESELVAKDASGAIIGRFKRDAVEGWWREPGPNDPLKELREWLNAQPTTQQ